MSVSGIYELIKYKRYNFAFGLSNFLTKSSKLLYVVFSTKLSLNVAKVVSLFFLALVEESFTKMFSFFCVLRHVDINLLLRFSFRTQYLTAFDQKPLFEILKLLHVAQ